jgi:hypothetical protein
MAVAPMRRRGSLVSLSVNRACQYFCRLCMRRLLLPDWKLEPTALSLMAVAPMRRSGSLI